MIKKLTKHGNSHAIVIDKGILELLKIDSDTPLELTTDGKSLIITPLKEESAFKEALEWSANRYKNVFKELAE
ncbi:MAG: AbrB/MazE/SpoVT family DNA-binding domain-containing protein [bacterium]